MSETNVKTPPWGSHPRSNDKDRLAKFVLESDVGILVSHLRDLLNDTTDAKYDANDRLVRRWIEKHEGEYLWLYELDKESQKHDKLVFAREELTELDPFTEFRDYSPHPIVADYKWSEENLIGISNDELLSQFPSLESILGIVYSEDCSSSDTVTPESSNSGDDDDDAEVYPPKEFVQNLLRNNIRFCQKQRVEIARQFMIHVDNTLEAIESGKLVGNQYVGYGKLFDRMSNSFDRAIRLGYRRGVHVTLTCSPDYHNSISETSKSFSSDRDSPRNLDKVIHYLGNHGDWAGAEQFSAVQNGRPHRVSMMEVMDNGMLHVHLVLFGACRSDLDINEDDLANYWSKKRQVGEQVSIDDVHLKNGDWIISDTGQNIETYLCKVPGLIDDIKNGKNAKYLTKQDEKHWTLGVLWAISGISQLIRRSSDLSNPVEKDVVDDCIPESVQDQSRSNSSETDSELEDRDKTSNSADEDSTSESEPEGSSTETERVPDWINTPLAGDSDSEAASQKAQGFVRRDFNQLTERDIWLMQVASDNCRKQGIVSRMLSRVLTWVWMIVRTVACAR